MKKNYNIFTDQNAILVYLDKKLLYTTPRSRILKCFLFQNPIVNNISILNCPRVIYISFISKVIFVEFFGKLYIK